MQPFVYRWLCVLMALSCAQMHMPHVAGTSLVEEASKQITVVEKMHGRQKRSISLKDASVAATGTTTPEHNIIQLQSAVYDFRLVEPGIYRIGETMQFGFFVSENSHPFFEPSFGVTMTSTADCTMTNMTPLATIIDGLVLFPKVTLVPNAGNTSAMCKLELTLLETATTILFQQVIAFNVTSRERVGFSAANEPMVVLKEDLSPMLMTYSNVLDTPQYVAVVKVPKIITFGKYGVFVVEIKADGVPVVGRSVTMSVVTSDVSTCELQLENDQPVDTNKKGFANFIGVTITLTQDVASPTCSFIFTMAGDIPGSSVPMMTTVEVDTTDHDKVISWDIQAKSTFISALSNRVLISFKAGDSGLANNLYSLKLDVSSSSIALCSIINVRPVMIQSSEAIMDVYLKALTEKDPTPCSVIFTLSKANVSAPISTKLWDVNVIQRKYAMNILRPAVLAVGLKTNVIVAVSVSGVPLRDERYTGKLTTVNGCELAITSLVSFIREGTLTFNVIVEPSTTVTNCEISVALLDTSEDEKELTKATRSIPILRIEERFSIFMDSLQPVIIEQPTSLSLTLRSDLEIYPYDRYIAILEFPADSACATEPKTNRASFSAKGNAEISLSVKLTSSLRRDTVCSMTIVIMDDLGSYVTMTKDMSIHVWSTPQEHINSTPNPLLITTLALMIVVVIMAFAIFTHCIRKRNNRSGKQNLLSSGINNY